MKRIQIKNETYNLPMSWDEITVNQLVKIETLNKDEEVSLQRMNNIAAILLNCEADIMAEMAIDEYMQLLADITDVMGSSSPSTKFQKIITLDGVKYEAKEVQEWNTREFTDFDTLSSDKTNLPLLLALIYREEGEELNSSNYAEKIKEKAVKFNELPASVAIGAISFFSKSLLNYIHSIVSSSEAVSEAMKKNPKMKEQMKQLEKLTAGAGL